LVANEIDEKRVAASHRRRVVWVHASRLVVTGDGPPGGGVMIMSMLPREPEPTVNAPGIEDPLLMTAPSAGGATQPEGGFEPQPQFAVAAHEGAAVAIRRAEAMGAVSDSTARIRAGRR
jgi:hypothetical protein